MKKITRIILTFWVTVGLFLSACASMATLAGLPGTSWKLVSYGTVRNPTPAASGIDTNLDFGKDGMVNGNFGCNSFSGNYQATNGNIAFSMMISTMMACVGPQMNQEDIGLKIMKGTASYKVAGNTLTIYSASGDNAITLSRAK